MREEKDIRDDEIRILGNDAAAQGGNSKRLFWIVAVAVLVVGLAWFVVSRYSGSKEPEEIPAYFEPVEEVPSAPLLKLGRESDSPARAFCEIRDTTINDIPLRIFIPHHADMSLHVGLLNREDTTIVYAAQAADIRADNGKILGAFVLKGEPLAWGLSKKGFCASIDGVVTIGVSDNSPLFEEATERGGYFFRQYPLVKDGVPVENQPKNKSERRAICGRAGEILMVECLTKESFHDFSQALADLGIEQAVYLVGGRAYGWACDEQGERYEFGDDGHYTGRLPVPENINYIVWRENTEKFNKNHFCNTHV